MSPAHPLDRAVWSALEGRHARFAIMEGVARRYGGPYGVFAACLDRSDAGLADLGRLVARHGDVAMLEAEPPTQVPGVVIVSQELGVQMTATDLSPRSVADVRIIPLDDHDGAAMLALATLTRPGPFFELTHKLGDFFGIKVDGQLVAMAGERLKPHGFTEVSGVCTHPDYRGNGYAAALMQLVARRILARGETPFLHAYASNANAIALYRKLGFSLRCEVLMTRLSPVHQQLA